MGILRKIKSATSVDAKTQTDTNTSDIKVQEEREKMEQAYS